MQEKISEFIPYEQALDMKDLGYDEEVLEWYDTETRNFCDVMKEIKAPLYQQAFRWFREKHDLFATVEVDQTMEPKFCYSLSRYKGDFQWDNILPTYSELYYTYEETELGCLKKLIEIVKTK
jgi:hypothetical protein